MKPAVKALLGQQNLLDKVIAYFDPARARRRMVDRGRIALMGGYTGARRDRAPLSSWNPGSGSPTTDAVNDLPELRDRSRDQMRNAPVAAGALNGAITGIVGTGLAATPSIDHLALGLSLDEARQWCYDTRRAFEAWAASEDCDVSRDCDFYGLQELAKRTWLESGDAFVITARLQRAGRKRLALQLVEGDRVCNPSGNSNSATLIEGLELSAETMETVAVHVAKRHPGDYHLGGANEWARVQVRGANGRRNVLHLFKPLRPGMKRGMPWISPIIEPLKQLGRWTDNELNAAVTSSIFSVFAKMDVQAFESVFRDDDDERKDLLDQRSKWTGDLESGKVINLLPGEDIGAVSAGRPNPEFDPFWTAIVRQIGMVLELPYEVLVMHFQSSYSAARGALLMGWRFYKTRRDLLAKKLCQPVYELWLADEIAEGRIAAPGYFASEARRAAWNKCLWTGDGPGSIDPQKEVGAARERVALGISTLAAESLLVDGVDWETKHRQRVQEVNAQRRDGLEVATHAPPAPPAPSDDEDGRPQPRQGGGNRGE